MSVGMVGLQGLSYSTATVAILQRKECHINAPPASNRGTSGSRYNSQRTVWMRLGHLSPFQLTPSFARSLLI